MLVRSYLILFGQILFVVLLLFVIVDGILFVLIIVVVLFLEVKVLMAVFIGVAEDRRLLSELSWLVVISPTYIGLF